MSLKDKTLSYLLRPRVVHQLPGRLRIHLPLLQRIGGENGSVVDLAARLVAVPDGITDVQAAPATGNVLVQYDAEALDAEDVQRYLHALTRMCVANRARFARTTTEAAQQAEKRLRDWLRTRLNDDLDLEGDLRIPDDVLA